MFASPLFSMLAAPSQSGNDEIAERSGTTLLYVLAWTLFGIGVVNGGLQIYNLGRILPGNVAAIALAALIFWLLRLKRSKIAAAFFVVGLLLVLVINSLLHSTGVYAVAWVGLPIASMTSGWLLGRRAVVITTVAGIGSVWSIFLLGQAGYYVVTLQPSIQVGVTLSAATVMGALIGLATSQSFAQQLASVVALSDELRQVNRDLEARVRRRTEELTDALKKLKTAQNTLIENEKFASLGAMVASVSHELYTPLGNILMVNSSARDEAMSFANALASGDLRRSSLDAHAQSALEAATLIESSTRKAIELIGNFKQVAADQMSEQRRPFDLGEVVQSYLTSLGPWLQGYKLNVQVDIPASLICDSYPGPLGQIITNLVINAGMHGYPPDQGGTVIIHAAVSDGQVRLTLSDKGNGMDPSVLAHIFDPFFTTRLGKGGTGLGMSICKRIATKVLGGELTVTSVPNEGTQVALDFPMVAPEGALSDIRAGSDSCHE